MNRPLGPEIKRKQDVKGTTKFLLNIQQTGIHQKSKSWNNLPCTPALFTLVQSKQEWDMIYMDASHKSDDTLLDAMLAWKGLRKSGLLIFDDYVKTWISYLYRKKPLCLGTVKKKTKIWTKWSRKVDRWVELFLNCYSLLFSFFSFLPQITLVILMGNVVMW